jgi:hypothetical protein
MKRAFLTFQAVLFAFLAFGQDVEFSVSAPSVVAVGEKFRFTYNLNARPQEFNPPSFGNFYVLAGPSISQSSSVEIVNGKVTQNYSYVYTYIFEATTEGKYTIEPAKVTVNRKEYQSDSFTIEVVKGNAAQPKSTSQQGGTQQSATSTETGVDEYFVAIELDRQTVYRGQPVLATIKIYTRQSIAGFEEVKFPAFSGFWNQEVETPDNIQFQRKNINGRIYNEGVLRKYLLFPQQTGDIKIDPFETVVLLQQRAGRSQSIFDDFFGMYQTVRKRLVSKPVTIKVKDLPANAPASFNGAVGKFSFETSIDKNDIKTNEAATVKVRIAGSGNIRLIESPKIEFPSGFETFDPKVTENINTTTQGASGSKVIEFVAIPRTPGKYEIDKFEFTYFDPNKETYVTLKSKPISINVESDGSQPVGMQAMGFGKEDVKFIGKDIRFIKTEVPMFRVGWHSFYGSLWQWLSYAIVLAIFAGLFVLITNQRQYMNNITLVRTRRANKVARKRLESAHRYMNLNESEHFYDELLKCMWGYIADKLSIPIAELSSDSARETLIESGVSVDDSTEFLRIISECEYARFAPKSELAQMGTLYSSAHTLISKFEDIIKK